MTFHEGHFDLLRIHDQKGHVIGHDLRVADGHYAELTPTEQPGETGALSGDETGRFGGTYPSVVTDLEIALLPAGDVALRTGEA